MSMVDLQIAVTFALVAAAIVAYAQSRIPIEVTSIAVVVAVLLFFQIMPVTGPDGTNLLGAERVLSGFASPALASIMALMVMGQGLYQTGALEAPAEWLLRLGTRSPVVCLGAAFLICGTVSAFMNNTPVVVMFIPVITGLAARLRLARSRVVMPLSSIAILGGMTTVVGSSTNLVVSGVSASVGGPSIEFFDPLMPGIVLTGVGALYVLFVMPILLGDRDSGEDPVTSAAGRQFIADIDITPDHVLLGATSRAGLFPELKTMTVRLIRRAGRDILPPFEDVTLRAGDTVIVAATRAALAEAIARRDPILSTGESDGANEAPSPGPGRDPVLAEAMVAPGSRLIGQPIDHAHRLDGTPTTVIGVQRRSRMARVPISDIRLESGDVVLVLGEADEMQKLRANRDLLLLEWSQQDLPRAYVAWRAITIMGATLIAAATGALPIAVAALAGALAMIAAGCLNIRQAARAFDRSIYLLVGASLALAAPLEATGAARLVAETVVGAVAPFGPAALLAALFGIIAIFTNLLSNHATAALFTPIAVSAAQQSGVDPMVFVLTVIYAANCCFATPMAYQTNLLVVGPGRYRFVDFVKAGTPLIVVIWVVYSLFAPWYFGL